jgi:hypothetical protein
VHMHESLCASWVDGRGCGWDACGSTGWLSTGGVFLLAGGGESNHWRGSQEALTTRGDPQLGHVASGAFPSRGPACQSYSPIHHAPAPLVPPVPATLPAHRHPSPTHNIPATIWGSPACMHPIPNPTFPPLFPPAISSTEWPSFLPVWQRCLLPWSCPRHPPSAFGPPGAACPRPWPSSAT